MVGPFKLYCDAVGKMLLGMWRMPGMKDIIIYTYYNIMIVVMLIIIQTFMYAFIVGHSISCTVSVRTSIVMMIRSWVKCCNAKATHFTSCFEL